jgi:[acyl-carrier-protein] S-malonyltransferase
VLALTFPGQGSQRPGMGAAWTDTPSWEVVGRASAVADRDMATLLLDADAEELRATRNAQLTTFVTSLVALDALRRAGLPPAGAVAGHSLGEYTALTAAGALSFEDGLRLVTARGEAMQAAADARPGTMAAVLGLDLDAAEAACAAAGEAWVANDNAPGQVVVAGTPEGVEAAVAAAKERGARKVLPLPVGGAFHTPLMAAAAEGLTAALATVSLRNPAPAVVANVDASPHATAEEWRGLLADQLCRPVRWRSTLERLGELAGDDPITVVEIGPGGVLTGMAKRTLPGAHALSVAEPDHVEAARSSLAPA